MFFLRVPCPASTQLEKSLSFRAWPRLLPFVYAVVFLLPYSFSLSKLLQHLRLRLRSPGHQSIAWCAFSFNPGYSQSESSLAVMVGNPLRARSALIPVKCVHSAGTSFSGKIASTGHSGTQASQSIQVSG